MHRKMLTTRRKRSIVRWIPSWQMKFGKSLMTKCRTDITSVFNTRTVGKTSPPSCSSKGKERLMKIQQHDGVVVDAAEFQQGFAKRLRREGEV